MRVALAQFNPIVGDLEKNSSEIIKWIKSAKSQKADLIVFPELAICGYPPKDLLLQSNFVDKCHTALQTIAKECDHIGLIIGAPSKNLSESGKGLFNTAFFIHQKKIQYTYHKCLLPSYDIFDEDRYFEAGNQCGIITFKEKKICLTICEDLWNLPNDRSYLYNPIDELIKNKLKPDLHINIAASPFHIGHYAKRVEILKNAAQKLHCPTIYLNQVGAQTDILFDGSSQYINAKGQLLLELNSFQDELKIIDTQNPTLSIPPARTHLQQIHEAITLGIRDFFKKQNLSKALIGLSGGVDSALVAYLCKNALGRENVHCILMPSPYSSDHSITDAVALCKKLQVSYDILPIEEAMKSVQNSLSSLFKGLKEDTTEENIQSRIRGLLLMAYSNKMGHILINTTNKSEAAVGYGTLYGDMCGGLSVIGDLYKTQVYQLCHWINQKEEIIPENILTKEPSAELKENQKDSDSLPDYAILDAILQLHIEEEMDFDGVLSVSKINPAIIKKILKLVALSEHKRQQFAPVLRISSKAFGPGRRIPIVGKK